MEFLGMALALIGVALATALPGSGSAIGLSYSSRAGAGVMSEKPEMFGSLLVLIALPGTQGIYGFVFSFLLLTKLGVIGGGADLFKHLAGMSPNVGLMYFAASLPIAIAGWLSAIYQGKVVASGIQMLAKQPDRVGPALIMGILVEFYAILGLLASIFIYQFALPAV